MLLILNKNTKYYEVLVRRSVCIWQLSFICI